MRNMADALASIAEVVLEACAVVVDTDDVVVGFIEELVGSCVKVVLTVSYTV